MAGEIRLRHSRTSRTADPRSTLVHLAKRLGVTTSAEARAELFAAFLREEQALSDSAAAGIVQSCLDECLLKLEKHSALAQEHLAALTNLADLHFFLAGRAERRIGGLGTVAAGVSRPRGPAGPSRRPSARQMTRSPDARRASRTG